ncbi:uncharacterized protein SOCE26_016930 [Sorangium cellulosum]|uniref:Uncharacterized protein n=1 Tax=Sorangium cellulosum TaxID=56 RepID=A0A2L0ELW7_SORCE|nr:uncharacterized protein SOCE26_016930 [Sorangium cellulosum]
MDQTAERILFATSQDGSVTMVTQVQYAGAAPDFFPTSPSPRPSTTSASRAGASRQRTRSSAADSPSFSPCASTTCSLYVPALAGTAMDVASPAAFVIVAPSVNVPVPAGASQTALAAAPVLLILIASVPDATEALAGNT